MQRGLGKDELAMTLPIETTGLRCVNRVLATAGCNDRARVMTTLARADIPVPESWVFPDWRGLLRHGNGRPLVVKTRDGNIGRSINILISTDGNLPQDPPFDGPYLAQAYLPDNPAVQKLYVVGKQARGLLKPSPIVSKPETGAAIPFDVDPDLLRLAARIGETLELDIFGADIRFGPDGPTVVDVNPFPGFRGIADADRLIAGHILSMYKNVS